MSQDGDYYGPMVDLASRVTRQAQPGALLATEQVRREVGLAQSDFRFDGLGHAASRASSSRKASSTAGTFFVKHGETAVREDQRLRWLTGRIPVPSIVGFTDGDWPCAGCTPSPCGSARSTPEYR